MLISTFLCGFVLQSEWYCQNQVPEVDNISHGCYQALLPTFCRREPGNKANDDDDDDDDDNISYVCRFTA